MGVVFQDFRLLDHLTTFENVALPLRVKGREESAYRSEVTELLKWVGLGDKIHAVPQVLSGGEKQRAAIARALIAKPDLLLADEPTGNVDPSMAMRLLRLFIEMNRLGTAVVIATGLATVMLYARVVIVPAKSRRLTVKFCVPNAVGVPLIAPPLRFSPAGRLPAETDHVYGFTPPLAASVIEYGVPIVAPASAVVNSAMRSRKSSTYFGS